MRKRKREEINKLGKEYYGFDLEKERNIYFYLCRRNSGRYLSENEKFETYSQWKKYITGKFAKLSKEQLFEFSKYLSLRMENNRPLKDLSLALYSAGTTIIANTIIGNLKIDNIKWDFVITVIVAVITFGISVAILSCQTADTYKNERFYEDYIEIINELNEKKKEQ